jgi:alkanesulfonate monooxygenase SsuD/methylene tetrahydromethanopterin reductase-like flavin-dependent oxidoreductase (luciferase family)
VRTDVSLDPTDLAARLLVEAALTAERSGFDGVWMYDHISGVALGGDSISDPWPLLGAIAASTERISLGPLVANATVRHAAHIAVASATLQDLSGGRFLLGIGAGAGPGSSFADEMVMVGLDPKPAAVRRGIVVESIDVIRRLWSGGGDVDGEHLSLHAAAGFPAPEVAPPIIVGANGPKMAAIAGSVGDGVNLHSDETDLAGLIAIVRDASPSGDSIITVEAPLEPPWFDGQPRERMLELGVDRLILRWHGAADDLESIESAGKLITSG